MLRIRSLGGYARHIGPLRNIQRNASIKGRATKEATLKFVSKSKLKLYHQFSQSGLFINPVIHGSPRTYVSDEEDLQNAAIALLQNRSNCLVIYDHNRDNGKPWHLNDIDQLICPEAGVRREEVVVIANLGRAPNALELYRRLAEASRLTHIDFIDIAIFEVTYCKSCINF